MLLFDVWLWINDKLYEQRTKVFPWLYCPCVQQVTYTVSCSRYSVYSIHLVCSTSKCFGISFYNKLYRLAKIQLVRLGDSGGYLLFFLIFRTHITDKRKISLYAIASLSYYLLCIYVLEDKLPCLYRTSYALLLGLLWKYYEPRIVRFLNTKYMIIPVTIISTVGFVLAVKSDDMLFNPLFAAMTFVCLAYLIPLHKDYAAVKVLSKISYEYYLWQGLSIAVVFDCLHCKSMLIAIPLCLLINAVLSIIAHYSYNNNSCQNLVHQKV